jgi:hypothetical protein
MIDQAPLLFSTLSKTKHMKWMNVIINNFGASLSGVSHLSIMKLDLILMENNLQLKNSHYSFRFFLKKKSERDERLAPKRSRTEFLS